MPKDKHSGHRRSRSGHRPYKKKRKHRSRDRSRDRRNEVRSHTSSRETSSGPSSKETSQAPSSPQVSYNDVLAGTLQEILAFMKQHSAHGATNVERAENSPVSAAVHPPPSEDPTRSSLQRSYTRQMGRRFLRTGESLQVYFLVTAKRKYSRLLYLHLVFSRSFLSRITRRASIGSQSWFFGPGGSPGNF